VILLTGIRYSSLCAVHKFSTYFESFDAIRFLCCNDGMGQGTISNGDGDAPSWGWMGMGMKHRRNFRGDGPPTFWSGGRSPPLFNVQKANQNFCPPPLFKPKLRHWDEVSQGQLGMELILTGTVGDGIIVCPRAALW
jgi:hypothetical protein